MSETSPTEKELLLRVLNGQRRHLFQAVEGVDETDLRRPILPSGWSCLGLINHVSSDDERFWFQAVIAGEQSAIDEALASIDNAWEVSANKSAEAVLEEYRDNIDRSDAVISDRTLESAPAWWPDFFGSWKLETLREVLLHVITETATHAGHLDAARELIDGKQHLVLTD